MCLAASGRPLGCRPSRCGAAGGRPTWWAVRSSEISGARAPRGVCMSAGCVWRETDRRRERRIWGVAKKGLRGRWPRDRLQLVSSEVAAREWANLR